MKDHYIICGAGKTGHHAALEMKDSGKTFLAIDTNTDFLTELKQKIPDCLTLAGDATLEHVLHKAHIKEALGLIACLSSDKDNLFLTFTARLMNPTLKIVARTIDESLKEKLHKAGADHIVSPNRIGGQRMTRQILKPHVIRFLDRMLHEGDQFTHLEQIVIPENSYLANKTLKDAQVQEYTGMLIIAYSSDGKKYMYNPQPEVQLQAGGVLIFMGEPQQQENLQKLLSRRNAPS